MLGLAFFVNLVALGFCGFQEFLGLALPGFGGVLRSEPHTLNRKPYVLYPEAVPSPPLPQSITY